MSLINAEMFRSQYFIYLIPWSLCAYPLCAVRTSCFIHHIDGWLYFPTLSALIPHVDFLGYLKWVLLWLVQYEFWHAILLLCCNGAIYKSTPSNHTTWALMHLIILLLNVFLWMNKLLKFSLKVVLRSWGLLLLSAELSRFEIEDCLFLNVHVIQFKFFAVYFEPLIYNSFKQTTY